VACRLYRYRVQAAARTPPTLDRVVCMIASLGGFPDPKSDGFPGPQTLCIRLQRAADFVLAMDAQRCVWNGRHGE
jgi:hypothetical protein